MCNKLQIGTIAYKQNGKYASTRPLFADETAETKRQQSKLFTVACDMFLADLFNYITLKKGANNNERHTIK